MKLDEDKARSDIARGIRFKEWAEGEQGLFAVFDAVERNYAQTLKETEIHETDVREPGAHTDSYSSNCCQVGSWPHTSMAKRTRSKA